MAPIEEDDESGIWGGLWTACAWGDEVKTLEYRTPRGAVSNMRDSMATAHIGRPVATNEVLTCHFA